MRITWKQCLAPLSLAVVGGFSALAQPANNACANAINVGVGSVSGTTVGATTDAAGGCSSSNSPDVWYSFLATVNGTLTLSTCGGASWDTVLGVWTGCPASGGTQISCNDDSCGLQSTVTAPVEAGSSYLIRVAGFGTASGAFVLNIEQTEGGIGTGEGPDVVYSDISGVAQYGPVGGIYAYAFGTGTCNIGDVDLRWGNSWSGSPSVGFNAYRLHDGRLMQIGQSWVKRACCAAATNGCSLSCNGVGGSMLGSGCRDSYSASYNGGQSVLSRRSQINAFTGVHAVSGAPSGTIGGRLQIRDTDMSTANFPGALWFGEGVYVGSDDAAAGNAFNNASYRRLIPGSGGSLAITATTRVGEAAIYAWRDHGLGVGIPDPSVEISELDIANEGRFLIASKVRDLGNGTWRYDYAIFNINSDRSGGGLVIPKTANVNVTNVGFHDVDYHSGEPYDNTDWVSSVTDSAVGWSSPQTFAQNPNSNALRWGTMYNFWFDADRPPTQGTGVLTLFKPHTPQTAPFTVRVPSAPPRPGDLDGDGDVDLTDLAMLLSAYGCGTAPCVGDIDGDGDTDLTDLAMLLSVYGT